MTICCKQDSDETLKQTLFDCKFFSCLLLGLHEALIDDPTCKLRVFKCLIATTKYSIDQKLPSNLHEKIQKHCDGYFERVEIYFNGMKNVSKRIIEEYRRAKIEMYVLYAQDALSETDFKMAKFYEQKAQIEENISSLDANTITDICRTIYNSAFTVFEAKSAETDFTELIWILKRLLSYLKMNIKGLSANTDYPNLKYTINLFLVNLAIEDSTKKDLCQEYIKELINEYHQKIEPYKLAVKFHELHNPGDFEHIEEILMHMFTVVNVVANFDSVISFINHQAKLDTKSALRCLDYIFYNKINAEKDTNALELYLTSRVYVVSQSGTMSNDEKVKDLSKVIQSIEKIMVKSLSRTCITGTITMLFNKGKLLFKAGKQRESVEWFKLALNDTISAGYIDKGKIQRALQFAYIDLDEFTKVENVFNEMSHTDQRNALSQLNMFRVFIHKNDLEAVKTCLSNLMESNDEKSIDSLILAVSECERSTDAAVFGMLCMFEKIQRVGKESIKSSRGSSIICSLRYTTQMILKMTEKEDVQMFSKYLPLLHELLGSGIDFIKTAKVLNTLSGKVEKSKIYDETISIDDIEWFASSCYNLARKFLGSELTTEIETLITDCKAYLDLVPKEDLQQNQNLYYQYWEIRTEILALIHLGENTEWIALQQRCVEVLHSSKTFFISCEKALPSGLSINDVRMAEKEILLRSFEAALNTSDIKLLLQILDGSSNKDDMNLDEGFFTSFQDFENVASDAFVTLFLKTIIQRNIDNTSLSNDTLSQWIRALLQYSSKEYQQESLLILKQFEGRVKHVKDITSTEIEWLTTVIWNQGISHMITNDKNEGITWCKKAFEISQLSPNDALQNQLEKFWTDICSSLDLKNVVLSE